MLAAAALILLITTPALHAQSIFNTPPNVAEQFLLAAANRDRAARGLQQLHLDPTLTQAACAHAQEMASHRDISHQFPGEPKLSERGANAGARFSLISENVAEAPIATMIHDLWMQSEGHRENLLDPSVDAVGIAVIMRDDEYYAVEDFAESVQSLSFNAQESAVASLLAKSGMQIANGKIMSEKDARHTCRMSTGYVGPRQPWYIMRYTAHSVTELPAVLRARLTSGKYHQAVVGACAESTSVPFAFYNIAVLLYP
ncbi:CAP domain-containing protein [Edaphobacter paludis]|uniref:CAP domain-containing protein n=1 Tax=Edaphobacter paludis TaxID=3035702 RepID=A0AAU7D0X0_9BACT